MIKIEVDVKIQLSHTLGLNEYSEIAGQQEVFH